MTYWKYVNLLGCVMSWKQIKCIHTILIWSLHYKAHSTSLGSLYKSWLKNHKSYLEIMSITNLVLIFLSSLVPQFAEYHHNKATVAYFYSLRTTIRLHKVRITFRERTSILHENQPGWETVQHLMVFLLAAASCFKGLLCETDLKKHHYLITLHQRLPIQTSDQFDTVTNTNTVSEADWLGHTIRPSLSSHRFVCNNQIIKRLCEWDLSLIRISASNSV